MIQIILYTFLIICAESLTLDVSNDLTYCFKYTWVSTESDTIPEDKNCTTLPNFPCMEDPIPSLIPPDLHQIWNDKDTTKLCSTTSKADVCIKFNLWYNDNIITTTAFCGKVTEDKLIPVTSGCYEQRVNGYTIEMCACESRKGSEPCNMSARTGYSFILTFSVLLVTFMFTY
ncbi:uncharacterized protein LOC100877326 [Megachile rotundata]|uniref:uncharacterized protein LOC100877326 n=1 Tax=Megachile rotundata TaxID=143995 RepID=UPI000258E7E6|nr:PREDICTED: uncharacterized protein LOC100877326 [Megachile rotundata]